MYSYIFLMHQVRRRVKALKKLQLDATNLEAKFYEEVYALEKKYHALHNPLYQQRASITDVSIGHNILPLWSSHFFEAA